MTTATHQSSSVSLGPTERLSTWIASIKLDSVPSEIRTRAKYLILDGLACGLVGAHLPWSEIAATAIFDMEPVGESSIFGWNRKIGPLPAALLNSTFIQGFELDDWHNEAPLHSNSILLPALFSAAQHASALDGATPASGSDLLLATIAGYEVGPRVGRALWGPHILTSGWHSGAVFGPAASAAAVGKLLGLSAPQIEDALGIACTQACGLMSAQFESDVKRMQHGFAARNGLMAALLAKGGYVGIKRVFEREYGGFLKQFSLGNGKEPHYLPDEVASELGKKWQTNGVRVKPYAALAMTHPTVDCMRKLQEHNPNQMRKVDEIRSIKIEMGDVAFHKGGWKATRPLTSIGAQMSCAYVGATQLVDRLVLPAQFRHDMLIRDEIWRLVDMTECVYSPGIGSSLSAQDVTITFDDGTILSAKVESQRGVNPPLSNEEIVEKWRLITKDIIDIERSKKIEDTVIHLEECRDVAYLGELMSAVTKNPIA